MEKAGNIEKTKTFPPCTKEREEKTKTKKMDWNPKYSVTTRPENECSELQLKL